jgi:hypothetical protein
MITLGNKTHHQFCSILTPVFGRGYHRFVKAGAKIELNGCELLAG